MRSLDLWEEALTFNLCLNSWANCLWPQMQAEGVIEVPMEADTEGLNHCVLTPINWCCKFRLMQG